MRQILPNIRTVVKVLSISYIETFLLQTKLLLHLADAEDADDCKQILLFMKTLSLIFLFFTFGYGAISNFLDKKSKNQEPNFMQSSDDDFKNFYGICWRGDPHENLQYAKQMRYNYVFYQKGMELDPLSKGLCFYLETPEYYIYNRTIDTRKKYSQKDINFYETKFAKRRSDRPFPHNLATGWFFSETRFTPILDFQQQNVINWAIDSILNYIKSIEKRNPDFHFAGYAWDVPQPEGDFWNKTSAGRKQVSLKFWNGGDFSNKSSAGNQTYSTYSLGRMEYYKQLMNKTKSSYPYAKFIIEPYNIYNNWISKVENLPTNIAIIPDLIAQESSTLDFVNDKRIQSSLLIKKDNLACTSPSAYQHRDNLRLAANAAIKGYIFTWYGRFGGNGEMPNYLSIKDVPDRLKLIRILSTWENSNGILLSQRHWNGVSYISPTAFVDDKAILIYQPKSRKLFVVFLNHSAVLSIPKGQKVVSIYKTNDLLIETEDGRSDIFISNEGTVKLQSQGRLNKCYILKLAN